MNKSVTAVVVCAGSASRMGGIDKIFADVGGIPVVIRTLSACDKASTVTNITVVTKPENTKKIKALCKEYGISKPVTVTAGGDIRADSVRNGVAMSSGDFVAIMDGARPMITPELIDKTCDAAFEFGAAALGVKMTDTVKKVDSADNITATVDRSELVRIQTPQVFEREKYLTLSDKAKTADIEFTDDCMVFEYFGEPVKTVYGTDSNVKITVKQDLEICNKLLGGQNLMRVGHGYDVHKLVKDRGLWLCGEKIDFELGLLGHSDADVALHALTDAMLGAAAMGDIGKLFPDSDPKYKGISSITLLKAAAEKIFSKYTFGNCDITIIAQKPKLAAHIPQMRQNIADALQVGIDSVNVKATTEEGLGFTGALEGISAHAVCVLYRK